MSRLIATPAHRAVRRPSLAGDALLRVRRIGYAVLGLQWVGFLVWSVILYQRYGLTADFAQYHQSWVKIAHGDLNPYDTVGGFPFWQNHFELIIWPMSVLYWVWPHDINLLWIQDSCVVATELVAFRWLCDIAKRVTPGRDAALLAGTGIVLLAINPWTWWSVSFDFHAETVATLFAALLIRDLSSGRRRAWVWVVPLLGCGDVAGTYLAGAGLGGVLAGRQARRPGAAMAVLGVVMVMLITLIHGNLGSGRGLQSYAYLAAGSTASSMGLTWLVKGILTHPLRVLHALWSKRLDVWANIGPAGILGVGFIWLMPLLLIVLLENNLLQGLLFASPSFQGVPLYVLLPVGTVAVLAWLMRLRRRLALAVACLLIAQAVCWATIWGTRPPAEWIRISARSAATLAYVNKEIPAQAEVVASQGVVGRFSGRQDVRALLGPGQIPISGQDTWFVVLPAVGIEVQSTASALALIGKLAGPLHATLVTHANGVWAFRWRPPAGLRQLAIPDGSAGIPAWAARGAEGHQVMTGPVPDWHEASEGVRGYVDDGLAWQLPAGRYEASVVLSATGPANIEVWDDTGNVLLSRRTIAATGGVETVTMPVNASTAYRALSYAGWGPFRADFLPPPPGQRLEMRIWSPGGEAVNVYHASLTQAG